MRHRENKKEGFFFWIAAALAIIIFTPFTPHKEESEDD